MVPQEIVSIVSCISIGAQLFSCFFLVKMILRKYDLALFTLLLGSFGMFVRRILAFTVSNYNRDFSFVEFLDKGVAPLTISVLMAVAFALMDSEHQYEQLD